MIRTKIDANADLKSSYFNMRKNEKNAKLFLLVQLQLYRDHGSGLVADDFLLEMELWFVLCSPLAEHEVRQEHGERPVVPRCPPVRHVLLLRDVALEHQPPGVHT